MPRKRPQAATLELRLLGRFSARASGAAVEKSAWRRPKAEQLVKLLAVEPGHHVHRERAMDALWPDLAPDSAANQLAKMLSFARRALEPDLAPNAPSSFLDASGGHVGLKPDGLSVDADAFEAAAEAALDGHDAEAHEAALALYTGELLEDEPYAEWAAPRRERLALLRTRLLAGLAALRAREGDAARAAAAYEHLLAADPSDEEAHRALMRLYAGAGDRRRALLQYRRCREALRRELDADPDPETVALHAEILAGRLAPAAPERPANTSLPTPASTFVGREAELEIVRGLLGSHRLVTLTGTGGVGKTRLAIEAAAGLAGAFPDGVRFADLSALADPALVARPLAAALGVAEARDTPLAVSVAEALAGLTALVVLDNCEHMVEAAARLVSDLLRATPRVRVLATSREALGAAGERVWLVPSLGLPAEGASAEAAASAEAVRLFAERAALAGFELTSANAGAVAELCRRLDGIPLAVELAAARARSLAPEQMLARLDDRFRLLDAGAGDRVARQRTLRAAIDWSYQMLSEPERALLASLSVFAGGFTLEAAEAVSAGPDADAADVLPLLARLADRSLVVVESGRAGVRYRLLETIRRYGADRLAERGDETSRASRHAAWLSGLAREASRAFGTQGEHEWLERLDEERDNARAALAWYASTGDDAGLVEVCLPLGHFWTVRGHWSEGHAWLDAACEAARRSQPEALAGLLDRAGTLAFRQGDFLRARGLYEEALALRREGPEGPELGRALYQLAITLRNMGEPERAGELHRESLDLSERGGDVPTEALAANGLGVLAVDRGDYGDGLAWFERGLGAFRRAGNARGMAMVLHNMGEIAMRAGDPARAAALLEASRDLSREHGFRDLAADTTRALGYVALIAGDAAAAVERYREALEQAVALGARRAAAVALGGLGFAAARTGDLRRAMTLAGVYAAMCEEVGYEPPSDEREKTEAMLDRVRAELPAGEADALYESGRALSFERAVAVALGRR